MFTASLRWRALQRRRETRAAVFREALDKAPPAEAAPLQEALDALLAAQSLEVFNLLACSKFRSVVCISKARLEGIAATGLCCLCDGRRQTASGRQASEDDSGVSAI